MAQSTSGMFGSSLPSSTPISVRMIVFSLAFIARMRSLFAALSLARLSVSEGSVQVEQLDIVVVVELVDGGRLVVLGRREIAAELVAAVEDGAQAAPFLQVGQVSLAGQFDEHVLAGGPGRGVALHDARVVEGEAAVGEQDGIPDGVDSSRSRTGQERRKILARQVAPGQFPTPPDGTPAMESSVGTMSMCDDSARQSCPPPTSGWIR